MTLTKEDLEAIGSLIDEKLAPIKTDIHYMKGDIEHLKRDISQVKFDVAALRHEITIIKIDVAGLQQWRSEAQAQVN